MKAQKLGTREGLSTYRQSLCWAMNQLFMAPLFVVYQVLGASVGRLG